MNLKANGIAHLSLPVTSLAQSMRFYRDVLGMRVLVEDLPRRIFMEAENVILTLDAEAPLLPAEHFHFGFFVAAMEDLEAWIVRLKQHAVAIIAEEKSERGWSINFHDPDGYRLEITYFQR